MENLLTLHFFFGFVYSDRDGQGMQVHREVLKVVSGGVCIFFIVVTIRHLKETFARRRAGLPSVISDGHKC